jgi:hypothetical protein
MIQGAIKEIAKLGMPYLILCLVVFVAQEIRWMVKVANLPVRSDTTWTPSPLPEPSTHISPALPVKEYVRDSSIDQEVERILALARKSEDSLRYEIEALLDEREMLLLEREAVFDSVNNGRFTVLYNPRTGLMAGAWEPYPKPELIPLVTKTKIFLKSDPWWRRVATAAAGFGVGYFIEKKKPWQAAGCGVLTASLIIIEF